MTQPPVPSALMEPLADAVHLFEELRISYALVGGIAAMVHGRARFTEDVDFVAATGHETLFATNGDAMRRHHFDPACTWMLYHSSGATIDIWKDAFSEDIARRAIEVPLGQQVVRVAEVHDLIAMKLRAGRFQDDYDISEMLGHGGIDPEKVRLLVTPEQFERFEGIQRRLKGLPPVR